MGEFSSRGLEAYAQKAKKAVESAARVIGVASLLTGVGMETARAGDAVTIDEKSLQAQSAETVPSAEKEFPMLAHRVEQIRGAYPGLDFRLEPTRDALDNDGNPNNDAYEIFINGKKSGFTSKKNDDSGFLRWVDRCVAFEKEVRAAEAAK